MRMILLATSVALMIAAMTGCVTDGVITHGGIYYDSDPYPYWTGTTFVYLDPDDYYYWDGRLIYHRYRVNNVYVNVTVNAVPSGYFLVRHPIYINRYWRQHPPVLPPEHRPPSGITPHRYRQPGATTGVHRQGDHRSPVINRDSREQQRNVAPRGNAPAISSPREGIRTVPRVNLQPREGIRTVPRVNLQPREGIRTVPRVNLQPEVRRSVPQRSGRQSHVAPSAPSRSNPQIFHTPQRQIRRQPPLQRLMPPKRR